MLIIPQSNKPYRILGIDPGTSTLGVSVLDFEIETSNVQLVHIVTLDARKEIKNYQTTCELYGERFAKLMIHEKNIYNLIVRYEPNCIISESPYMGRFPQAFAALTQCLLMLSNVTYRYNSEIPFELVDPPTVKKAVGAKPKGSNKDPVKEGLFNIARIEGWDPNEIERLDEHSVDATAVAYSKVLSFRHTF